MLEKHIQDKRIIILLTRIIESFHTISGKGLPLGNLTSQLLVNIYMNEFDQFVKHKLREKYYIRYADDFVILGNNYQRLTHLRHGLNVFLEKNLKLSLHPDKVYIQTFASGMDFLGWVHFLDHRVLRTTTKRRMLRNLRENFFRETILSYLGLLKYGNTYKVKIKMKCCIMDNLWMRERAI